MMDKNKLLQHARSIPSLGWGGKEMQSELIAYAQDVGYGGVIIDIAPYLGSTTAFLLYGVLLSGNKVLIHVVDQWKATDDLKRKAKKFNGIDLVSDENFRSLFVKNIDPFKTPVIPHTQSVNDFVWGGPRIDLLIDDICWTKDLFQSMITKLTPSFIPMKTIVFFMNYHFKDQGAYQRKIIQNSDRVFEHIKSKGKAAIFLYLGGNIQWD